MLGFNKSYKPIVENLEDKIDNLENKINQTNIKIDKVINILDKLIQQNVEDSQKINTNLDYINRSAQNMDHHINFVENVFDVVKHPFSSLLRLYYTPNNTKQIQKDILDIPCRLPSSSVEITKHRIDQ